MKTKASKVALRDPYAMHAAARQLHCGGAFRGKNGNGRAEASRQACRKFRRGEE